jgi:uncharacterized membrane protein YiaA
LDIISLILVFFTYVFLVELSFQTKGAFWAVMAMALILSLMRQIFVVDQLITYGGTSVTTTIANNNALAIALVMLVFLPFLTIVGLQREEPESL